VARWAGDVRQRLAEAGRVLVVERGFDAVTVAAIARRAGAAESSFYRHFPDKAAVLQEDVRQVADRLTAAVLAAPARAGAVHAAGLAVEGLCSALQDDRAGTLALARAVAGSASLRDRQLSRHAQLADAVSAALQRRGVGPATADLTAATVLLVLRAATADWAAGDPDRSLGRLFLTRLDDLGRAFAA